MHTNSVQHRCALLVMLSIVGVTTEAQESAVRETTIVRTVRSVRPAVAAVYMYSSDERGSGSGAVIDPRGYVLTAKHVVGDEHVVLLEGRPPMRASVVGTMPEFDLAILKLGDRAFNRPASPAYPLAGTPPSFIRLGIADEVMLGETILNIGAPGGREVVVTQGIVSAVGVTGGNALSLATQSANGFNQLLQFDAASNPGNSGGPLINAIGQQVGVVTGSVRGEEGIHFAVPLRTIRRSLPQMLYSELRHRFRSGIGVDPQLGEVCVTEIEPDSPASAAGIKRGDQIISIAGRALRDPVDWEFTKFQWRAGQSVDLGLRRGSEELSVTVTLDERDPQPGVEVDEVKPGVQIRAAAYDPRTSDPLVDDIRPGGPAMISDQVVAKPEQWKQEEHYEVSVEGLLKIDQAGLYRLSVESDDGSKLYLHDRQIIDNGGNHAAQQRTGWALLDAGYHPFRIEFYEDEGNELLRLLIAAGDNEPEEVPAEQLFHEAR